MTSPQLEKFNVLTSSAELMEMIQKNGKLLDHTNETGEKIRFVQTWEMVRQGDIYLVPRDKFDSLYEITNGHAIFPAYGRQITLTPEKLFKSDTHVLHMSAGTKVFLESALNYSAEDLLHGPIIQVGNECSVVHHHEHAPIGLLPNVTYKVFYQEDYLTSRRVQD